MICEINPWFLEGFGVRLEELTGFFFDQGYRLYHYRAADGRTALVRVDTKDVVEDNYVFIHPQNISRFNSILAGSA